MPNLVIIAGANGAGKSTSAPFLLRDRLRIAEFVNADDVARGLSGYSPESVATEAGRIALLRLRQLASVGADIGFETTLASRGLAAWIREIKRERGYRFHLVFLWLPNADEAEQRVAGRVQRGGHSIPADVIRRRYLRGIVNFHSLYTPIADSWVLYDNSSEAQLVAERAAGQVPKVHDPLRWSTIMKQAEARQGEAPYGTGEPGLMGVPTEEITRALRAGARAARWEHKALGFPIVIWRDGRVVEVLPEEIVVDVQ